MYQTNSIYKNNLLLCVYFIFFAYILAVWSETIFIDSCRNSTYNYYDVTTIYRITNMSNINDRNVGFSDEYFLTKNEGSYSVEIHSRTNALGMPLQNNAKNIFLLSNGLFSNGLYQHNSRIKNVEYDSHYWKMIDVQLKYVNQYKEYDNVMEFRYDKYGINYHSYYSNYNETIFTIVWTPDRDYTCLTTTYIHLKKSYLKIDINIIDESNNILSSTRLEQVDDVKTLTLPGMALIKDQQYKVSLVANLENYANGYGRRPYHEFWFGLLRIAQCLNNDDEDFQIVSANEIGVRPKAFEVLGNGMTIAYDNSITSTKSCLNGGYVHPLIKMCVCPPGFKGTFCETGCGSNVYGADCTGICSMHPNSMCRRMFMCTNYGCTCSAGLTGPLCDKDCDLGKYGADCKQTCSSNCYNNMCDQYTGKCSQGCSPGYVPPNCQESYPYLISPPTLLSNKYESIEIALNFQSDNVEGDKNKKLTHYQILYKTISENKFKNYEPQLINQNNESITEILNDLEPDTQYIVGVLVITDDGNFNDQDVVYGQYNTSCIQPSTTDYNVKVLSGNKSVNVTWDKITHKRLECKVMDYILSLTFNQSRKQHYGTRQFYIASSNSYHFIDDLYPGYLYSITLTPRTTNGPLLTSPTYSFTPLLLESDIKVKDVVTTTENGKIRVSWKLKNTYNYDSLVDGPVTCIVRYKITKILSCSLKENIQSNWTSVTLKNRTNYEIFDTVPNSQYCIQVVNNVEDIDNIQQENMVYAWTPATNPTTAPVFDDKYPLYVTNNSVSVQWKTDEKYCKKLNGFFSKFYIELKDKKDSILQMKETKQNFIYFDDLKSNTPYELKVFIKTHMGFNPEHFLIINFTTKVENLKPVDDLVVYKKSLKNRIVGLRWSYLDNTNLDGFIISFNEGTSINAKNVSIISPTKCSAWPQFYCHTFQNLIPSNNYTFQIKPKSQDYPDGGKASSISFSSIDSLPDAPNNLKAVGIGNTYTTIQWDIPWIFNGVLKSFQIYTEEISSVDMNTCCVSNAPIEMPIEEEIPTYNYTLTDLKPGSVYSVGVSTVSKSLWYSSPTRMFVTTLLEN